MSRTGLEDAYIMRGSKKLRMGYTTGSCAAAAARGAAFMLLSGKEIQEVKIHTPKGIVLNLELLDIRRSAEKVSCAVRKDGDPEVIRCGMEILSITTVPYFLCGIMDLFPGALRGMGCSAVPMILSVIGTVGTRIVWIFGIFPQHRSLYVLFISYPGSWIITIIMQVICYLIVRKKVHSRAAAV